MKHTDNIHMRKVRLHVRANLLVRDLEVPRMGRLGIDHLSYRPFPSHPSRSVTLRPHVYTPLTKV